MSRQTKSAAPVGPHWTPLPARGLLQRTCACGGRPGMSGDCPDCKSKRLSLAPDLAASRGAGAVPPIVHEVLRSPGRPLEPEARGQMEPRFGHDFSRVRIHADARAAESARAVGALAYTVGQEIVFAAGRYAPGEAAGRRLLAHELTHTIQQGEGAQLQSKLELSSPDSPAEKEADAVAAGATRSLTPTGPMLQKQNDAVEVELEPTSPEDAESLRRRGVNLPQVSQKVYAAAGGQTYTGGSHWKACGRKSNLRVDGFRGNTHGTHISAIVVEIKPKSKSTVSLTWANAQLSKGTLPTSLTGCPGAGNCNRDCSVQGDSEAEGSHCTPLGSSFNIQGYDCQLRSDAKAKFVSWFHFNREIAFHYEDIEDYPASHGCVRLSTAEHGAEWIYDNSLAGVTQVTVKRDPAGGPGPECWSGKRRIARPAATPAKGKPR